MRIDVVLTAEAVTPVVREATVLVVDVLRASTTIVAALAAGAAAVVPAAGADEARRRAASLPPDAVLIAGERRGEPLAGFDLGNSPLEFVPERVRGKTIVLTTSNGTRALLAARPAPSVAVAALTNLSRAAAWALREGRDVMILCAGERGAVSLEDHACAGLLVEQFRRQVGTAVLSAPATSAAALGHRYASDVGRLAADSGWARHLVRCGRSGDVAACLALDTATLVPVYLAAVDKVVAAS